jgi:NosR/NirI family transcriptional regulator, nitrous oxide reductase regulator
MNPARSLGIVIVTSLLMLVSIAGAGAAALEQLLTPQRLNIVFPGADHVGKVDGAPPAAPVFRENKLVGYVFLTWDVVKSGGYSGKPVKIIGGFDLGGRITGAVVAEHQEPILVLGIPDKQLDQFIAQFKGKDLRQQVRVGKAPGPGEVAVDMVTGASITSLVFSDAVMRAGRLVARSRGVIGPDNALRRGGNIDLEAFYEADWPALLADGSLSRLRLSNGEIDAAFLVKSETANAEKLFVEMFAGLATPAAIGQNILDFAAYNQLMADLRPGYHAIFVAGRGFFSFRGYNYRRSGVFERLQLVQGDKTIRLTKAMHQPIQKLPISGAPKLREASLFILPPKTGFDPVKPWRLEILVQRDIEGIGRKFAGFPLNYTLPSRLIRVPEALPGENQSIDLDRPIWEVRWRDSAGHIIALSLALTVLLVLLFFQDWATKYRHLVDIFRLGFLTFTLVYIGWVTSAQLSVINVMTFAHSLLTGFQWEFFLIEPLIFILWGFVFLALLFWGRGVFCGWLCPFGAIQELLNRIAVKLGVRQYVLPFSINERLWPLKYVFFLGLFALSLGPVEMAEKLTEVEPFKTAITLKFARAWPFVVYAVSLLVVSMFVNRVFCRYLCPLGAALAIPASNRMFDWLKRHKQCGSECHVCAIRCPVQAIHPDGHIDVHECIYCLDCQLIYHDDQICPPLVDLRKRRERRQAWSQGEATSSPSFEPTEQTND